MGREPQGFLKYEAARLHLGPTPIRRVLVILGLISVRSGKGPRYRGAMIKRLPGSILVTDGKTVQAVFTGTGEIRKYNWQGIIDQATICHTAVVVTGTESAAAVREAFDESCKFLGRPPLGLLHDNKPIHDDVKLREHVKKTTIMIPATPSRGENKAGMEGEFGKFEQAVGTIYLDDSSDDLLKKTAVREVLKPTPRGSIMRVALNSTARVGRASCGKAVRIPRKTGNSLSSCMRITHKNNASIVCRPNR